MLTFYINYTTITHNTPDWPQSVRDVRYDLPHPHKYFYISGFCSHNERRSTVLGYQVSNISTCRTLPQHILNVLTSSPHLQTWLSLNIPLSPEKRFLIRSEVRQTESEQNIIYIRPKILSIFIFKLSFSLTSQQYSLSGGVME